MREVPFILIAVLLVFTGCAHSRLSHFRSTLDPLVGKGNKVEVNSMFGSPTTCKKLHTGELCEYRTAHGRNDPVPIVYEKNPGFGGPDLSPYSQFDVLQVEFDTQSKITRWFPLVLRDQE